jgi:predicted ArsR family transcriptional regulator
MSSIFPISSEKTVSVEKPEVIELESQRAEVVLDALSSKTTREVFLEIYEQESSISQISDRTDNSIQNVKYHIEKLEESNLIEVARINHTENGNQMKMFCPKSEAVVLLSSQQDKDQALRSAIKKIGSVITASGIVAALLSSMSSISTNQYEREAPSIQSGDATVSGTQGLTSETAGTMTDTATDISVGFISGEVGIIIPAIFVFGVVIGVVTYSVSSRLSS